MTFTTRQSCRLCSGSLRTFLQLPDTPLANDYPTCIEEPNRTYPLHLSQCEACGHVQLPVVVDPKRLFSSYRYTTATSAAMRRHVQQLADEVARPGAIVVDVGSNDGTLIAAAHIRSARAIGVDPALNLAAEATAAGRLTLPGFFMPSLGAQLRNLVGSDMTVTALNVFAHADDLGAIADAAKELIGRNGTFVFEVAYLLDVLEKNEIGTIYHEHLSHHHVAPLVGFFRRHGMVLNRIKRLPIQGGSIRGYVSCSGEEDETVMACVRTERAMLPGLLEAWPARIVEETVKVEARLEPYRGKGLAVFGAPARLTTWAYTMGLVQSDVSCVFDDEPRKVGLFTPGLRWPIVASSELMERNPPAVLVASWNYVEDIKRRFPDYRGEWVVPR